MNITLPRAVIEQAVEALEEAENVLTWDGFQKAADALRVALGQQYMTNAAGELEPVTIVQTGVGIGKPEQEPVATVTSETGAEISMSWWHEPALPVGTKLYTAPQRRPEQEPVAWIQPKTVDAYLRPDFGYETCSKSDYGAFPVYTAPSQRKPLTDDEIQAIWKKTFESGASPNTFARAIEAAHGIKEPI